MAVYDRGYRGYSGATEPAWNRFLVIARYAFRDVFASKFFLAFFVACFVLPLACGVIIYLKYNVEALAILQLPIDEIISIDASFFRDFYLTPQASLSFVLILIVGPALISPDLRNGALPLYLSRPLNKTDYVLGKLTVLAVLGSLVTWIPGMVLFGLQAALAGGTWVFDNARIAMTLFIGAWAYILSLSVFALAVSAWVKWKPWARVVFLGVVFTATAFGQFYKGVYDSPLGSVFVLSDLFDVIWSQLFGLQARADLAPAAAWGALILFGVLSLGLLYRRIRAFEVVS